MRNKLKRSSSCRDTGCQSREPPSLQTSLAAKTNHDAPSAAKHTNIAPVFMCAPQQSRSAWISDGRMDHPAERKQISVPLQSTCGGLCSPSALHICLEEIQASNPAFPVQTVFRTLQKKANERKGLESTAHISLYPSSSKDHLKEKRKRGGDASCERVSKRQRCILTAEGAACMDHHHVSAQDVQESVPVKRRVRSKRLSRIYRLQQQSGSLAGPVNNCEPTSDSQSPMTGDTTHRESCVEDVLWTDKYSPRQASEVIGNSASVNKLHSWLMKWKLKADTDENRKMEERKTKENSKDSWDSGDFQGEAEAEDDGEELLCNTMLITGPAGVGKTAAVYACAQELGFKVFEVNSSSQRSGRHVLAQLKEATQSHLVETSGEDPLKPAYFNNYTNTSCTPKSETGKTVHPKNVKSTSKKRAAQKCGRSGPKGKANPATVTLTNYFKMKAKADHLHFGGRTPCEKPDSKKLDHPSLSCDQTVPENKKTATSLILFEEVDVIFDDDVGFLAAIKTFMTTTKRPVILTTNDPSFRERFKGNLEEIIFKSPSQVTVCSYLQLVGLAENVRLQSDDVSSLLRLTRGDVRRCLLQLQLWVRSGGGRASQSAALLKEPTHMKYSNAAEGRGSLDSQRPPCATGCTANMLGLDPFTQIQLLNHLKCLDWSETHMNKLLRPLAESWRRCVPLLYSNLELLLPIRTRGTSVHCQDKVTSSGLQRELVPGDTDLHVQRTNGNISPKASSINSKCVNISRLSRRKRNTKDTTVFSTLTYKLQIISLPLKEAHSAAPGLSDKAEQIAAKAANNCFNALTDFFDLMSYLDATLPAAAPLVSGSCRPQVFVWPGAEIKDGLSDEVSDEEDRSWSREWLLNFQAAVEGLGCHRCCRRVSEAWIEAQKYRHETEDEEWGRLVDRLTLPASSKRESLCFSFQPLCAPSVSQQRYELSQTLLGSKSFSLLGNRQAVTVDYLPVLRFICRFQKACQLKKKPFRCLNSLDLSESTIQLLAEDFSEKNLEQD